MSQAANHADFAPRKINAVLVNIWRCLSVPKVHICLSLTRPDLNIDLSGSVKVKNVICSW